RLQILLAGNRQQGQYDAESQQIDNDHEENNEHCFLVGWRVRGSVVRFRRNAWFAWCHLPFVVLPRMAASRPQHMSSKNRVSSQVRIQVPLVGTDFALHFHLRAKVHVAKQARVLVLLGHAAGAVKSLLVPVPPETWRQDHQTNWAESLAFALALIFAVVLTHDGVEVTGKNQTGIAVKWIIAFDEQAIKRAGFIPT